MPGDPSVDDCLIVYNPVKFLTRRRDKLGGTSRVHFGPPADQLLARFALIPIINKARQSQRELQVVSRGS